MNRAEAVALAEAAWLAGAEVAYEMRAMPDPEQFAEWLRGLPARTLPGPDEVFVVVTPPGVLFAGYYDRDRAKGAAKAMNGTVSPLPIAHDYRQEQD